MRRVAQLDDLVWLQKIGRLKTYRTEPEIVQCGQESLDVFWCAFDPHIEIFRVTRVPMKGDGITSDNQVTNLTGV